MRQQNASAGVSVGVSMESIMTASKKIANSELRQKAYAIYYDRGRRDRVLAENAANHGRSLALDVATGDYEIDDRLPEASFRLRQRHPTPESTFGYTAVFKRGGPWKPEVEP